MTTEKVLLVVDVQRGFLNEHTKHIPNAVQDLQFQYDKVYASRFINGPNSLFRTLLNYHDLSIGSREAELAFECREGTFVFDKLTYTSVTSDLMSHLGRLAGKEIHLAGIDTDACVLTTAIHLFDLGFVPIVLTKFCASSGGQKFHEDAIEILRRQIGLQQVR